MMKKQINILFLLTILSITLSAQSFEGMIKMTSDSPYGINADFTIKGDKILLENDSKAGKVQLIFEKTTGDITTITNENGRTMAIKTNMENNPYVKGNAGKITDSYSDYKVEKTTETKTIDGYNCTKFIGKGKTSESIMWITNEINFNWADLSPMKNSAGRNPYKIDAGTDGMIMEMQTKEKNGKIEWTMTADVTEMVVNDAKFAVPTGVQVMDMTDMRQLMMEAQKNPEKMKELKEMMQKMEGQ